MDSNQMPISLSAAQSRCSANRESCFIVKGLLDTIRRLIAETGDVEKRAEYILLYKEIEGVLEWVEKREFSLRDQERYLGLS